MATASSNRARIRYIKEIAFGETPTAGTSTDLRMTGESLMFDLKTETSKEIRSDRMTADLIQTSAEASGDVNFELSHGTFDDLMAAAFASEWKDNKLVNGVDMPTFSIEQGFMDVNQFFLYRGMAVNTMSLDFSAEAILSGKFGFKGLEAKRSDTTGVPTAGTQSTTDVMNATSNFADLTIDGKTYPCGIDKISLELNNNIRDQKGLGNLGACSLILGTFSLTGSIDIYLSDGSLYDKYIKNQSASITWKVTDKDKNFYTFTVSKAKFTSPKINAGGLDQDVKMTLNFQGLLDPTTSSAIQVTRGNEDAPVIAPLPEA